MQRSKNAPPPPRRRRAPHGIRFHLGVILREVMHVAQSADEEDAERFVRALRTAQRIYLAGVGRSGLVVKAFGQRLMHLGFDVHLADEITAPGIRRGDLLVACSGTGKTQLTLYMARKARRIGACVATLTSGRGSALARASDLVLVLPGLDRNGGSHPVSVQPVRSPFEQALFLYLDAVILVLIETLRVAPGKIARRHANLE